jgi:hypothetical protein
MGIRLVGRHRLTSTGKLYFHRPGNTKAEDGPSDKCSKTELRRTALHVHASAHAVSKALTVRANRTSRDEQRAQRAGHPREEA